MPDPRTFKLNLKNKRPPQPTDSTKKESSSDVVRPPSPVVEVEQSTEPPPLSVELSPLPLSVESPPTVEHSPKEVLPLDQLVEDESAKKPARRHKSDLQSDQSVEPVPVVNQQQLPLQLTPIEDRPAEKPADQPESPPVVTLVASALEPTPPTVTVLEVLRFLCERFPVFRDNRPLKIGIFYDLTPHTKEICSNLMLRKALRIHTHSEIYVANLAHNEAHRFDLDGNTVGRVTDEHQQHAIERCKVTRAFKQRQRKEKRMKEEQLSQSTKDPLVVRLTAKPLRVSAVIDTESFRSIARISTVGYEQITLEVQAGDQIYTATLKVQNFRKAQKQFRAAVDPLVLLAATLKGDMLDGTGLTVVERQKPSVPTH